MGDMGGGGVKNLKKVRDVLCERPLSGTLANFIKRTFNAESL